MNPGEMRVKDGWIYVIGEHDNGDHCVMRFPVEYYMKPEIPFQMLFTWEVDEGKCEDAFYTDEFHDYLSRCPRFSKGDGF